MSDTARDAAPDPAPDTDSAPDSAPDTAPGGDAVAEGSLPDAPLFALLRTVAGRIGVDRIDRVWLFPPRRLKAGETSVLVVAAYPELDDDRRRVYAAHYTAPADPEAISRLALDEFGTAPAERIGRVVEEVVERIKDDAPTDPPRAVSIAGDERRWNAMLHELAEELVEQAGQPGGAGQTG